MLAVSPLRNSTPCERAGDAGSTNLPVADDFSAEFDFDFSELFAGFADGEGLSGLEVDHSEFIADFPSPETAAMVVETMEAAGSEGVQHEGAKVVPEREEMASIEFEEVLSGGMMGEASLKMLPEVTSSPAPEKEKGRKPSAGHAKGSNGKRKMKVDWTPELHRQFVQAVEQLGVEKAVPSRILELMGIDCLTRHNVASHLQKYRSSRKHMLVRESEAASWNQRRQAYAMTTTITGNTAGPMSESSPWLVAPTMGFPAGTPLPPHHLPQMASFRPVHVWGHPTMDQSLAHMWLPKHLFPIRPMSSSPWVAPYHQFPPPHPPPHASPWNTHFSRGTLIQGRQYFSQQVPALRLAAPPVPGVPPHPMHRPEDVLPTDTSPTPVPTKLPSWQPHHDAYPSKESIDATIGEVLSQPWLPVPLGLKPPSLESVLLELQKQGIPTVPPSS